MQGGHRQQDAEGIEVVVGTLHSSIVYAMDGSVHKFLQSLLPDTDPDLATFCS